MRTSWTWGRGPDDGITTNDAPVRRTHPSPARPGQARTAHLTHRGHDPHQQSHPERTTDHV